MMPTTSEASTPSRSAIRRAESTRTPVVNELQLRFKSTATSDFRQPDQPSPICSAKLGYPILTFMRILRLSAFLVLSLFLSAQVPAHKAQMPSPLHAQDNIGRPDPKRAQKAAERGDKAAAAASASREAQTGSARRYQDGLRTTGRTVRREGGF